MTEAELSALTASLPGLMKRLRQRIDENGWVGLHQRGEIPDEDCQEAADALDLLAKALMQVMKERDEALNPYIGQIIHGFSWALDEAARRSAEKDLDNKLSLAFCKDKLDILRALKRPAPSTQETENG